MDNISNKKIAQNKLMILYIIKKSNSTITYNQLSNLILEYDLLNYFTFVEYFKELQSANFFTNDNSPEITLTDFSLEVLDLLDESIDENIKKKIDDIFSDNIKSDEHKTTIIPLKDGRCIMHLYIDTELDKYFQLNFTVDDIETAKKIEKAWNNKNKSLYHALINVIKEATPL